MILYSFTIFTSPLSAPSNNQAVLVGGRHIVVHQKIISCTEGKIPHSHKQSPLVYACVVLTSLEFSGYSDFYEIVSFDSHVWQHFNRSRDKGRISICYQ